MSMSIFSAPEPTTLPKPINSAPRLWMPKRVLFTPDALDEPFGRQIYERVDALGHCRVAAGRAQIAAHSALGRLADELGGRLPGSLSVLLLGG